MSDGILPQASLLLGIIPALILLYFSLKGYEDYYKDKTIFLTFIIGIIIGFISAVAELVTFSVGILYVILFPIFEQLFKTIVLNVRRLQEKQETVIYGLCLGLGFGSVFTPVSIIIANIATEETVSLISILIGSIGIILFHGATGTLIGYGVYSKQLTKYLSIAIISQFVITSFVFISTYSKHEELQIVLVIYGIALYLYANQKIMPRILIKRAERRKIKKLQSG